MQYTFLSIIGFLAANAAAAPGACQNYQYKDICSHCSYNPGNLGGSNCYKDCPSDWRQCKDHHGGYSSYAARGAQSYQLDYKQNIACPKSFSYSVEAKIETCVNSQDSSACLNVYYAAQGSSSKRGGISSCNLGIYNDQGSIFNPGDLNYNNYCHGNYCSVPTKNLPSYPDLCGKSIWLAVGNNECYNDWGNSNYKEATKYIEVTISCSGGNYKKDDIGECKEYCCCPPSGTSGY